MNKNNKKQSGFTLVEVLVVMLILVAMASVTLETTSELAFQGRYEVTKDRYEKIKQAIIGRPDVLINGQPDISGFVVDMGRLPNNIRELLDQNYCLVERTIDETTNGGTAEADCNAITVNSWITQTGWNGPYLTIAKTVTDAGAFPDGWGSESAGVTDLNYGWEFCLGPLAADGCYSGSPVLVAGELIITSRGKDQVIGGGAGSYDDEYPLTSSQPVINGADWKVNIDPLKAVISSGFDGSCEVGTSEYEHICKTINGAWSSPNCNISNEYLCSAILNYTWTYPTSTPSALYCSSTDPFDSTACTNASGTWDSVTNTCSDVLTVAPPVANQKLCDASLHNG